MKFDSIKNVMNVRQVSRGGKILATKNSLITRQANIYPSGDNLEGPYSNYIGNNYDTSKLMAIGRQ